MLINTPDKLSYKTTVTHELRQKIASVANENNAKTYLEIGVDIGYTIVALSPVFKSLLGIDIDSVRVDKALNLVNTTNAINVNILLGDVSVVPLESYDVVLIDARHDYESVQHDFNEMLRKNVARTIHVFFHDFGLVDSGVKTYVTKIFGNMFERCGRASNWNLLGGPTNDHEAAYVRYERM